jgi:prepilin-type N-terminal cleavage/methylation domain-containing protein
MNKSFTLIEILVVIVVIGILSAFILVGMSSISNSANIAKNQAFVNSLDNSLLLGRVSQWRLDEGSGTTANDSWLINNGTLATSPGFDNTTAGWGDTHTSGWMSQSNCISGTCLKFDGTDDGVYKTSFSGLPSSAITVTAWIKGTLTTSWMTVVGHDWGNSTGTWLLFLKNSEIDFGVYQLPATQYKGIKTFSVANNIWYHITGTYDGSIVKVYVNGSIGETTASTSVSLANTGNIYIGYAPALFNGLIDDARVYNQALSTSEIQQNYFLGLNSLYKNGGITQLEYSDRLSDLKTNLTQQ